MVVIGFDPSPLSLCIFDLIIYNWPIIWPYSGGLELIELFNCQQSQALLSRAGQFIVVVNGKVRTVVGQCKGNNGGEIEEHNMYDSMEI